MKLLFLIPLLFLTFLAKAQTAVYTSQRITYYQDITDTTNEDLDVNMSITLRPDSFLVVYNIDSNTKLTLKMLNRVPYTPKPTDIFRVSGFSMQNQNDPYEILLVSLYYDKNDLSLQSIGISDGISLIILWIGYKQKEL